MWAACDEDIEMKVRVNKGRHRKNKFCTGKKEKKEKGRKKTLRSRREGGEVHSVNFHLSAPFANANGSEGFDVLASLRALHAAPCLHPGYQAGAADRMVCCSRCYQSGMSKPMSEQ